MKRTEGTCWRCGKPANLYKRNAEQGRLMEYAGKTVFEHLTCSPEYRIKKQEEKKQ